jgi:hypothetical protein
MENPFLYLYVRVRSSPGSRWKKLSIITMPPFKVTTRAALRADGNRTLGHIVCIFRGFSAGDGHFKLSLGKFKVPWSAGIIPGPIKPEVTAKLTDYHHILLQRSGQLCNWKPTYTNTLIYRTFKFEMNNISAGTIVMGNTSPIRC